MNTTMRVVTLLDSNEKLKQLYENYQQAIDFTQYEIGSS